MRLLVSWDDNPDGSNDVLVLPPRAKATTVWLQVKTADGGPAPAGVFSAPEALPTRTLPGQPEHPHWIVEGSSSGGRLRFNFVSADGGISLTREVIVVPRWAPYVSAGCILPAVVALGVGLWTFQRGFSVVLSDWGSAKDVISTGATLVLGAIGLTAARFLRVLWFWKRCMVVLGLSLLFPLVPRLWVQRVDNGTGVELDLRGLARVPALGSELVSRSTLSSTLYESDWLKERYLCTFEGEREVLGGPATAKQRVECARRAGVDPWWSWLPFPSLRVGCDRTRVDPRLFAAWQALPGCKAEPSFETTVSAGAGHQVVVRPLEQSSETRLTLARLDFEEYGELSLPDRPEEHAETDLALELRGQHRLKAVVVHPGRRDANERGPALALRAPVLVTDRTLLGDARLGDVELGQLMCVLERSPGAASGVELGFVLGGVRLARTIFRRAGKLVSSFEASRPELASDLPACIGGLRSLGGQEPPTRLELFLAASWEPGGVELRLPAGTVPPSIEVFLPDGRLWGELGVGGAGETSSFASCRELCGREKSCSVMTQYTGVRDPVLLAERPGVTREGKPMRVPWQSPGVEQFAGWFWTCQSETPQGSPRVEPETMVKLAQGGKKILANGRLRSPPLRACAIHPITADEISGRDPATCKGELAAPRLQGALPAGCSDRSRFCP